MLTRSRKLLERTLAGGKQLTRIDIRAEFTRANIRTDDLRLQFSSDAVGARRLDLQWPTAGKAVHVYAPRRACAARETTVAGTNRWLSS